MPGPIKIRIIVVWDLYWGLPVYGDYNKSAMYPFLESCDWSVVAHWCKSQGDDFLMFHSGPKP